MLDAALRFSSVIPGRVELLRLPKAHTDGDGVSYADFLDFSSCFLAGFRSGKRVAIQGNWQYSNPVDSRDRPG